MLDRANVCLVRVSRRSASGFLIVDRATSDLTCRCRLNLTLDGRLRSRKACLNTLSSAACKMAKHGHLLLYLLLSLPLLFL